MRVTALTKYRRLAASTRQRFEQYEPYLRAEGIEVEYRPLLNDTYLSQLYKGQEPTRKQVAASYLERALFLCTQSNAKILWVHCEVFPYAPGLFERLVNIKRIPVIYDFDDAIFHNYDRHTNILVRDLLGKRIAHTLAAADIAFCGNAYLHKYARKFCNHCEIVPTVVDANVYEPSSKRNEDGCTIGWIGSPSTWAYVTPYIQLLQTRAQARNSRIKIVGAGIETSDAPFIDHFAWSEETEIAMIQAMDIGIMPLPDTPWSRGKCGYKLIQYMACGLPVVASPVGVNREIVEHGVNGFLAETEQEWDAALRTLQDDRELRMRMGVNGRAKIAQNYSIQVYGPKVARVMRELIESDR